jgi:hypothetical protein
MKAPARVSLAIAGVWAALSGCTCSRGQAQLPPEVGRDFGDYRAAGVDAAPYLALARSILEKGAGEPSGVTPPAAAPPGRRVVLALWGPGSQPTLTSATGATLADAITAAAKAMAARSPAAMAGRSWRLELDIPNEVGGLDGAAVDHDLEVDVPSVGLDGVLVTRDDGATGIVLPGEIVQKGLFHDGRPYRLDHDRIAPLLAQRAGVPQADLTAFRMYRFRVDAHVESADRARAIPVLRGMVVHPAQATPENLLAAVKQGADYLARILNDQGRYVYLYHPVGDRDDPSYGWLRHAGTTYALLEAYEEFGTPLYLAKAESALAYLKSHLQNDPQSQGKYILDTNDEEQQKVGGAGLALLAFAKHAAVTGKRDELETMRALARSIMATQYEDGHFRANADLESSSSRTLKREPVYYVGEGVLALLRLYAIDPVPAYLDAARRGADWVVHVRDAYVSEDNQEHDHWISYALNDLYRVVHDGAYIDHSAKIARAILKKQVRAGDAPAPDWVGTFYDAQTTPAATRVEAFDADIALSRFAGKPEAWLVDPAREVAASMLGQQFAADNDYWIDNPSKTEGGVRESLYVQDVRIDYVQHAMSAWMHLARILRDSAYGKTGVPSQDPVK